jgi:hypothetical protein
VVVVVVHGLLFLLFDIVGMSVFVVEILCPALVDGWLQVVNVFGVRPAPCSVFGSTVVQL